MGYFSLSSCNNSAFRACRCGKYEDLSCIIMASQTANTAAGAMAQYQSGLTSMLNAAYVRETTKVGTKNSHRKYITRLM